MAAKTLHRCTTPDCDWTGVKHFGRCPTCKEFGSIVEGAPAVAAGRQAGLKSSLAGTFVTTAAQRVREIDKAELTRTSTTIGEFDRVLGGGIVPGGVVLLAGEPGVGKSTLALSCANSLAAKWPVLYVSGEESKAQLAMRADRTGAAAEDLFFADENELGAVIAQIDQVRPGLLIVDSVQTIASGDVTGSAGGVAQVKEVSAVLKNLAKARGLPMLLIGQATKEGEAAGSNALMHIVDAVLIFEGDPHSTLRIVRVQKNRFGSADEVACFQMTGTGIEEVPDPSGLFLTVRDEPVPGTCVTVVLEGRRAMPAEVQALVTPSPMPQPRRGFSGLERTRMDMLIAVTQKQGRIKFYERDVYLSTVGGQKVAEPSADLAAALALVSAETDVPVPSDVVAMGEVALSGDIRPVVGLARRLDEAQRLGFRRALVPPGPQTEEYRAGGGRMVLVTVDSIRRAIDAVGAF